MSDSDPAEKEEETVAPFHSASCLIPESFDAATFSRATAECLASLRNPPDLVLAFVSPDYRSPLQEWLDILRIDGRARQIIGTSAGGLFGYGREHENASGASLLFLSLPGVSIDSYPNPVVTMTPDRIRRDPGGVLLFGNPVDTELESEIAHFNRELPGCPVLGGLVTGGPGTGDLFLSSEEGLLRASSLAVTFSGNLVIAPLVAQSCRPIGEPFVVTGSRKSNLFTIGRRKAYRVLEDTFEALPVELQAEAGGSIFAGLAVGEEVDAFDTGDFLIRHIVSADLEEGWLELACSPRVGQTMQFQIRDSAAAGAELTRQCRNIRSTRGVPFAAMICGGQTRGWSLYGAEDRDVRLIEEHLGTFPVAGLFSNGEIGPAGGANFRHDHSLCGALFYPGNARPET